MSSEVSIFLFLFLFPTVLYCTQCLYHLVLGYPPRRAMALPPNSVSGVVTFAMMPFSDSHTVTVGSLPACCANSRVRVTSERVKLKRRSPALCFIAARQKIGTNLEFLPHDLSRRALERGVGFWRIRTVASFCVHCHGLHSTAEFKDRPCTPRGPL